MSATFVFQRFKNKIKDVLIRRRASSDRPHTLTYESILKSLPELSFQEREAVYLELNRQLAETGESIAYAERIFLQFSRAFTEQGGVTANARILEIGPGVNLAVGVLFALSGVERYTGVDALAAFPERPVEFYRNLKDALQHRPNLVGRTVLEDKDFAAIFTIGEKVEWNRNRVDYVTPAPAEKLPFPDNHFDFVYSNASFEHFEEPEIVIHQIHRVLKPGGLTMHVIDLRDHLNFDNPLEFLKVGKDQYVYSSPYGTNRRRAPDFRKAFQDAGFHIRKFDACDTHAISDAEYESLDAYFKTNYRRDDLEVIGVEVVAQK